MRIGETIKTYAYACDTTNYDMNTWKLKIEDRESERMNRASSYESTSIAIPHHPYPVYTKYPKFPIAEDEGVDEKNCLQGFSIISKMHSIRMKHTKYRIMSEKTEGD